MAIHGNQTLDGRVFRRLRQEDSKSVARLESTVKPLRTWILRSRLLPQRVQDTKLLSKIRKERNSTLPRSGS